MNAASVYFVVALLLIGLVALAIFVGWLRSLSSGIEREAQRLRLDDQFAKTDSIAFDDHQRLPEAGYGYDPDEGYVNFADGGPLSHHDRQSRYWNDDDDDPLYEPYDHKRDQYIWSRRFPDEDVSDRWG